MFSFVVFYSRRARSTGGASDDLSVYINRALLRNYLCR